VPWVEGACYAVDFAARVDPDGAPIGSAIGAVPIVGYASAQLHPSGGILSCGCL
jgi:hypothetical protein